MRSTVDPHGEEEKSSIDLLQLNKRNTQTAEVAIADLYKKLYEVMNVVSLQQQAIGSLQLRLNDLEQKLILQKVQMTGLGPSVKSTG